MRSKPWLNMTIDRLIRHLIPLDACLVLPSHASDIVSTNCDAVDIQALAHGQATKIAGYDYGALDAPPHG